ncbi:glycosyl transferase, partial [Streptomyces sp. SID11233]|nr:glycosyl transferase [Streptomyces sp. SID11233]
DLILSDPLEFSAAGIGGILGVPVVHHRWDIEPPGDTPLELARKVLGGRMAAAGLDGDIPDPALVLDCAPRS